LRVAMTNGIFFSMKSSSKPVAFVDQRTHLNDYAAIVKGAAIILNS
jgi:hypothetical protein